MAVNFGDRNLTEDFDMEMDKHGRLVQRQSSAKSTGAGIGGLLGSIALPLLLAPVTGGASLGVALAGALGGGAGAFIGSKIGEHTSGVSQDDLLDGKFAKKTRGENVANIAKSEMSDVLKSTLTGAMSGFGNADKIGQFQASKAGGMSTLGALKEYGKISLADQFGSKAVKENVAMGNTANRVAQGLETYGKGQENILDLVKMAGKANPGSDAAGGLANAAGAISGADTGTSLLQMASNTGSNVMGSIPPIGMTEGMGAILSKYFPGDDVEGAADKMGMTLNEFTQYLQEREASGG